MHEGLRFYIDGGWVDPIERRAIDVINPATEKAIGRVSLGSSADVDRAVAAARTAFATYAHTSKAERIALLEKVVVCYQERLDDLAKTISLEMGAPMSISTSAHAPMGLLQLVWMSSCLQLVVVLGSQGVGVGPDLPLLDELPPDLPDLLLEPPDLPLLDELA